jgi:hypothetical protein
VLIAVLLNGCDESKSIEKNTAGLMHEYQIPHKVITPKPAKRFDRGFIQRGFYRVLSGVAYSYSYERPPLNYEDLPEINGETMAVKTNTADVNIEYQYCLYYDQYSEFDPCSVPMDWVIEKVDTVVTMPDVDTSGFIWGGYYVMQWKLSLPPNCRALDSFAIWMPNNVGIFMNKYAEDNGVVYYVSNPLLPTMYQEMAGTYIGNDEIYSLMAPDPEDADEIHIIHEKLYHPENDITKEICIESHCYQHYYFLLSCD